jgi:hypothetical protein
MITPKQADKIIAAGKPVTVRHIPSGDVFTKTFVARDRRCIESSDNGKFERDDLEQVT